MIAMAVHATHAPIHAKRCPIVRANAPTGPYRVCLPMANSTRISGTDQSSRNATHATRNEPPPFDAATRGNRHMLPVPTAMPSIASIIAQRLENSSGRLTCHPPSSEFAAVRPARTPFPRPTRELRVWVGDSPPPALPPGRPPRLASPPGWGKGGLTTGGDVRGGGGHTP